MPSSITVPDSVLPKCGILVHHSLVVRLQDWLPSRIVQTFSSAASTLSGTLYSFRMNLSALLTLSSVNVPSPKLLMRL